MIGLALALSITIWGQKTPAKATNLTPYSYQTFNCDNKGYFDSAKYKKEEIDGVNKLLYQFNGVVFDTRPVFKLSQLEEIRQNREAYLQELEKQYEEKKKEFYSLMMRDAERLKNLVNSILEIASMDKKKFNKDFELIANKILEEKSIRFVEQNRTNLDLILNPLKENIKAFEEKV